MKNFNTDFLHAYFICGSQDVPKGKTLPGIVAEALAAGITAFQFRDKGSNSTLSEADPEIGIAGLSQLVKNATRPIVAIGGITVNDLEAIAKTKAAGAAVISMIAQSNNIKQTVSQMLTAPWIKND